MIAQIRRGRKRVPSSQRHVTHCPAAAHTYAACRPPYREKASGDETPEALSFEETCYFAAKQ